MARRTSPSRRRRPKEDKKKHSDKDEEIRLEIEARREIEKKKWLEEYDRRHHRYPHGDSGSVVIIDNTGGGGGGGGTEPVYVDTYVEEKPLGKSSAGILFSPAQGDKEAGIGIQWLGPKNVGLAVWISGDLGYDSDVIDGYIPHDDYYVEESKGSYALEAIYGLGKDDAMLILGAGLAVDQTYYTAVSYATGWKWEGGTDSEVKPVAHASLKFRVAERVSMQFGYDTSQRAFFGLSGTF